MNSKIGDYDYELTTLRELTSSRTDAPFRLVDKTKTIRASRNAAAPYCKNLRNRAACLPPAEQTEKYVDPKIRAAREKLPIFRKKTELMEALDKNQVLIIIGETGSGKTSQLPQYLLELGLDIRGRIGCTQLKRMAAKAVARRVAKEQGCEVGEEVGYKVRFDNKTGPKTKIQYMTNGTLLRDCVRNFLINRTLSSYSAVILDESHERTVVTDILLGVLRLIIKQQKDLKLIISSATLDAKKFSEYFFNAEVFHISGRMYPVEIFYCRPPQLGYYVDAATEEVIDINERGIFGDIIVFMSGENEIEEMCDKLRDYRNDSYPELIVLPCYSALGSEEMDRIFEPTPPGKRKVVIATSIAETSLTIGGIEYVIDSGRVNQKTFDHDREYEILKPVWITQAQAIQRTGRVGRLSVGQCYRLYSKEEFETFVSDPEPPEIKRSRLTSAVLTLKSMGFKNLSVLQFIDEPPAKAIKNAENELQRLDAIDANGEITKIGRVMANFPLDPCHSKMLIKSVEFCCADEILTIVSLLSSPPVYARPRKEAELADAAKERFNTNEGDLLTMLNVYNEWKVHDRDGKWCGENFIHGRVLHEVENIREQLYDIMNARDMSIESADGDDIRILKSICSGMLRNLAISTGEGHSYLTINKCERVFIHPGSSLFHVEPKWVVYEKILQTQKSQKLFMRGVTPTTSELLTEVTTAVSRQNL